jgi:hypothetical protein
MKDTIKRPRIVLYVKARDAKTWNKLWKSARESGIFGSALGRFFLDKLAESERSGFEDIKKIGVKL